MATAADIYTSFMKFPDYKFTPYPKIIDAADGSRVTVHSAEEEEALKAPLSEEEVQMVAEEQAENAPRRGRGRR